jgi:ribosomal protein S18 acetylase RimI-like enzyme
MEFLESQDYETAVQIIKSNMISYYSDLGLNWDDEKRLEAYRRCKLWTIRVGKDIGLAMTLEDGDQFYLAELHIEEASRNQGYGSKALDMVKELAVGMGHKALRIRVIKNNPALHLYQRSGFLMEKELPYTYQLVADTQNKKRYRTASPQDL